MNEIKPGCSVRILVECTDEDGRVISDFPQGTQYGYDRDTANAAAIAISEAIGETIKNFANSKATKPRPGTK